jgi:dihydroflavonol-4-reductase
MKALVTGGAGFIGRHLVDSLLQEGAQLCVIDQVREPALPSAVDFRHGSVMDAALVTDAMRGREVIFHLAANAQLWAQDISVFERVNHFGTRVVLEAARRHSLRRIVHTSTEAVLVGRRTLQGALLDEQAAPTEGDMLGPYCLSKYRAEQAMLQAARDGQPVVIVNPTLPMGPGDWGVTPPTRMLRDFANGDVPAYLDTFLNIIDVRDCAQAHISAAQRGRRGERYILGGENISITDFLALIERLSAQKMPKLHVPYVLAVGTALVETCVGKLTGRAPRAPLTGVRIAGKKARFSNAKAREELDLTPRALETTLADGLAWLHASGLLHKHPA